MDDQKRWLFCLLCLLLVFSNVLIQIFWQRNGLDNQPLNSYHPISVDAFGYIEKAELIAKDGDFIKAFEDGFRMPGYPLFLSIFYHFSDRPLLVARYAQIVLSSLVILFSYLTMAKIFHSKVKAILSASVIALWLPFYYFSPILIAESCTIFLFSVFFYALSSLEFRKSTVAIYALPILLALLVYLKPNQIFLFIPLAAFLLFRIRGQNLWHLAGIMLVFIAMIIPWSVFISVVNSTVIPFSTTSGINLYLGTGVNIDQDCQSGMGSLSQITAGKLGLEDEHITEQVQQDIQSMSAVEKNTYYTKVAKKIWRSRPINTMLYGLSKIAHGFGFSFRGFRDVALVVLFVFSVASSIYLWVSNNKREWCVFFWSILFVASLQMFVFLPNQRFKTVIFDLPAIMILLIGGWQLIEWFFKLPAQPCANNDKVSRAQNSQW